MARPARRPAPARPTRPPPNSPSKPCTTRAKANGTKRRAPTGKRPGPFGCKEKWLDRRVVRRLPGLQGRLQAAHRSPAPRGRRRTERKKGPNREAAGVLLNVRGNGSTAARRPAPARPIGTPPNSPSKPCATRVKANGTKEGPQPGSGRGPFKCKRKWLDRRAVRHLPGPQGRLQAAHRSLRHEGEGERNKKKGPNREAAGVLWM